MVGKVGVPGVKVVLATGDPAMVVDSISMEGYRICVRGRLLGTMQARMYVGPGELLGLAGMALRGFLPLYPLLLPFFYLARRLRQGARQTED